MRDQEAQRRRKDEDFPLLQWGRDLRGHSSRLLYLSSLRRYRAAPLIRTNSAPHQPV